MPRCGIDGGTAGLKGKRVHALTITWVMSRIIDWLNWDVGNRPVWGGYRFYTRHHPLEFELIIRRK